MNVQCPDCGARYRVPASSRGGRLRCKSCEALIEVPDPREGLSSEELEPAHATEAEAQSAASSDSRAASRRRVKQAAADGSASHYAVLHPRPVLAAVIGVSSMLLGGLILLLAVLTGLGTLGAAVQGETEMAQIRGLIAVVQGFFGVLLMVAGIGMFFTKPWAWWTNVIFQGAVLLLNLKMLTPLRGLNWGHERAWTWEGGLRYILLFGVPALLSLGILAMLFNSELRMACGVKDRPMERHARRAGRSSASARRRH